MVYLKIRQSSQKMFHIIEAEVTLLEKVIQILIIAAQSISKFSSKNIKKILSRNNLIKYFRQISSFRIKLNLKFQIQLKNKWSEFKHKRTKGKIMSKSLMIEISPNRMNIWNKTSFQTLKHNSNNQKEAIIAPIHLKKGIMHSLLRRRIVIKN